MYYVYSLRFNTKYLYIGCTNNIRRRKDQHNENSRNRKSKLGRFLDDNGVVLDRDDFLILYASEDRHDALMRERDITKRCESFGYEMLNDNYTEGCSRKGMNIGHTAKEFVVVDVKEGTVTDVTDLRQYAYNNGIDYKSLHSTMRNDALYKKRYFAFGKDEWEECDNKAERISGEYYAEKRRKTWESFADAHCKTYLVEFPDGHTEVVKNLNKFAREHNLTAGTLHATLSNGKKTKGYKALKRI